MQALIYKNDVSLTIMHRGWFVEKNDITEVNMGLFKSLRSFFSGYQYRINREILRDYLDEVIAFAKEENLSLCDEFYLAADETENVKLHLSIINYDVPCDSCFEAEESMRGIIIFVNEKKQYDPEHDEKYYTPEDMINIKLIDYPQSFILHHEYAAPVSLEKYKI